MTHHYLLANEKRGSAGLSRAMRLLALTSTLFFVFQFAHGQITVTSGTAVQGYTLTATYVDPLITVSSASNISGFKVTITNGLQSTDVLSYTGSLPSGISATAYNSYTGVLAFNGSTSAANWQTLLRTVQFTNTNALLTNSRKIIFSAGSNYAFSNGHFYEMVSPALNWPAAKSAADAKTYLGCTGYLTTLTSSEENAFIQKIFGSDAWIGASDDYSYINAATGTTTYGNQGASEGRWYWVTGPEKGTLFSVGNYSPVLQSGQYSNWQGGEPNNWNSENYIEFYSGGTWNDARGVNGYNYIVEYGGLASDPVQSLTSTTSIYNTILSNNAGGSQAICYGATPSMFYGSTPSGGNGSFTYNWISSTTSASTGYANAAGANNTINYSPGALTVTTYYRRIVTSGSESDTTSPITITINPMTDSIASGSPSCDGWANGTASIIVIGGQPGFGYDWSGPGNIINDGSPNVSGLVAGKWFCTIWDGIGCSISDSVIVSERGILNSATSQLNVSCNGGVNGTASVLPPGDTSSYTYAWIPSGETGSTAYSLSTGSHTCIISNGNGCDIGISFMITEPSALSASTSQTNLACHGATNGVASVTVAGGTAGYTYLWSPSGGTSASATGLPAGNYSCTITDANGCNLVKNFTLTEPSSLSATTSQTNISCNGGTNGAASVIVSGGTSSYSYAWSPTGGTSSSATGLSAGNFSNTITDANGCTLVKNFTISQPAALMATTAQSNVSCNGGSNGSAIVITSGGTTGYSYLWSPSGGTSAMATGLTAGNYSNTITDANGCTVVKNFVVTQPAALSATSSQANLNCYGSSNGAASIVAAGGTLPYSYLWDNGDTTDLVSGLSSGIMHVVITDDNGCTYDTALTITQPDSISSSHISTNVKCKGGSDGNATIIPSGGTPPFGFQWTTGDTTDIATGLTAGMYSITITDANGCISSESVAIAEPTVLTSTVSQTNATCHAAANGIVSIVVTGGVAPYNYSWSTGSTNDTISGLIAQNYLVSVTDSNGCLHVDTVSITEPAVLSGTISTVAPLCNGDSNGSVSVHASGGTTPYNYSWSSGGNTNTENNLSAGTYSVIISDDNGCSTQDSVTVSQPTSISLITNHVSANCGQSNGSASVSADGGTGVYTYNWSSGGTSDIENNIPAGNYTVIVSDTNGCSASDIISVSNIGAPTVTVSHTNVSCYGGNEGRITLGVAGGLGSYTYLWSNNATTGHITGLTSGTYSYEVTDSAGCQNSGSSTITQPDSIEISSTIVNTTTGNNGSVDLDVTGGTAPYSYVWSNGATDEDVTKLSAGIYTVTVTDNNGCTSTSSVIISFPLGVEENHLAPSIEIYPNPNAGSFTIKSNIEGSYSIQNNLGQTIQTVELNSSVNYSMNVEGLRNGIYFIRLVSGAKVFSRKIVVTK